MTQPNPDQHPKESWLLNAESAIEEFITQDFTDLPEGKSECLQLDEVCRVIVNHDPLIPGQFCITAIDLIVEEYIAFGTFQLDDLTIKLRILLPKLLNGVANWVRKRAYHQAAQFTYANPQLA